MHRTTTVALLIAGALALTSCSTSTKPTPAATVTTTAPAAPASANAADLIQKCVDAVQADNTNGADDPECTSLPTRDYVKAVEQSNEINRAKLRKRIEDAAKSATP